MSVLLDTHIFYWWLTSSERLPPNHRALIEAAGEPVYVSAVTGWEMALKAKLGKWPGVVSILPNPEAAIRDEGFSILDISLTQAKLAGSLDLVHRDPFDRLLAAQSLDLRIPIATVDPAMALLGAVVV